MALRNLKNALIRLRARLKMPSTLSLAGIPPEQLQAQLRQIIDATLADPCCDTNPIPVTEELVQRVLCEVAGRG